MKKIYLLISTAILSAGAFAQTINQTNNAFILGDTYSIKQCDSSGVNTGGNGAGQVYNYSTVTIHNSTIKNYTAVTVASTGSAAAYPSAGIAVGAGANNNSYYTYSATECKYYGGNINVGGVQAVFGFSSPQVNMKYPTSLTTSTVSATAGTLIVLGNNGTFTGNATVTATGSGTLQLPSSISYPNVLKVVTTQTLSFSSIVTGTIGAVFTDFYSPANSKAPLFSIQTSTINSLLGNTTQIYTYINSNFITLSVKEKEDAAALSLTAFPNPANDNLTISYNNPTNEAASYQIINASGQLMKSENIKSVSGINQHTISLDNLNSGFYFVVLTVGDKTSYQKITKD